MFSGNSEVVGFVIFLEDSNGKTASKQYDDSFSISQSKIYSFNYILLGLKDTVYVSVASIFTTGKGELGQKITIPQKSVAHTPGKKNLEESCSVNGDCNSNFCDMILTLHTPQDSVFLISKTVKNSKFYKGSFLQILNR